MTTQIRRTLLHLAFGAAGFLALGQNAHAQFTEYPQEEMRYRIPPAATSYIKNFNKTVLLTNGDTAIYRVAISAGTPGPLSDSMTPSNGLPANLDGVWALSTPDPTNRPGFIFGLISVKDGSGATFAAMKSEDYGTTWTVVTSAALADPQFVVSPLRNYWKHGLSRIQWLADGRHGWIYGRGGIVRTTDGGDTWEVMYRCDNGGNRVEHYEWVNALAFRDSVHGAASLGEYSAQQFRTTVDGGRTWTAASSLPGSNRTTNLAWVNGEYRGMGYQQSLLAANMYYYRSTDMGASWTGIPRTQITTANTAMDNVHWFGQKNGLLLMRQGEIWRTDDGGRNWSEVKPVDPSEPSVDLDNNHFGTGKGYGEVTVVLENDSDFKQATIFKANTNADHRYLNTYTVYSFLEYAGVEDHNDPASTIATRIAPNPTSGAPSLTFSLKEPAQATIVVSSMMGVEVVNTNLGTFPAGERTVTLPDVGRLPAGTYSYTLRAGGYQSTGTLTVTR